MGFLFVILSPSFQHYEFNDPLIFLSLFPIYHAHWQTERLCSKE